MISNSHHATTRAIRHAQSAERFARAISKFAPRQNKSDPTRTKLREHMLDFHTTLRAPRNINIENDENNVLPRFRAFFCRGLQQRTAPATKNVPKASEVLRLTWNNHHVQNRKCRQFRKTKLSTLSKRRPSSPPKAPLIRPTCQRFSVQKVPRLPRG